MIHPHSRRPRQRVRQFAFGTAAALCVTLAAEAGAAIDLTSAQQASGQWDMTLNDTNRKCRLTLRPEALPTGFALAMPAGCRRAMPILSDAGVWNVPEARHLQLADAGGKTVLDFSQTGDDRLSATGPEGETYEIISTEGVRLAQLIKPTPLPGQPGLKPVQPAPPAPLAAVTPAAPAKPVILPAALALKPADIAGRYNIFRDGTKDTGCMLTLDDKARGLSGNKAQLAPACRDQGIVIFDPAGWTIDKGRLTLTARKGHQTHLDLQADGMWLKDPKEGKGLGLKKF